MTKWHWRKAASLALVALLFLGGCDDEEEKPPVVEVEVPKGVEVKIKRIEDDEMVIVAELAVTVGVVLWALFGPGARRRWPDVVPADDPTSGKRTAASKRG